MKNKIIIFSIISIILLASTLRPVYANESIVKKYIEKEVYKEKINDLSSVSSLCECNSEKEGFGHPVLCTLLFLTFGLFYLIGGLCFASIVAANQVVGAGFPVNIFVVLFIMLIEFISYGISFIPLYIGYNLGCRWAVNFLDNLNDSQPSISQNYLGLNTFNLMG